MKRLILLLGLLPFGAMAAVENLTADGDSADVNCPNGWKLSVSVRGTIGSGTVVLQRTDENSDVHNIESTSVTALPFDREVRCYGGDYNINLSSSTSPDIDIELIPFDPT